MKLNLPGVVASRTPSSTDLCLAILLVGFLIIVSASTAAPQANVKTMSPVEKWVVDQIERGEIADLVEQFSDKEKDKRKLNAHFLEELLVGVHPGFKPHRNGVRIVGAIIDDSIDLTNAQIPQEIRLNHCQFMSSATFTHASFAGMVSFDSSVFNADANFDYIKVGESFFIEETTFKGPVDFESAEISGSFIARRTAFENKENSAGFKGLKVRDDTNFSEAVFEPWADFISLDVGGNFEAEGARFHNDARFDDMKVRGYASFEKAVFDGFVSFESAEISGNLGLMEAMFRDKQKEAYFVAMKVRGGAFFTNAVFNGPLELSYADFNYLILSSRSWPKIASEIHMQGMRYKNIAADADQFESHNALLKLADQSSYDADVYSNLEEFFVRQGYRADADKAFIAGKHRERQEYFRGGHWFRWLWSWMLCLLVGYGRSPWQAGIPCALLVVLGCILFSPEKMEPRNSQETPHDYNRFWYSLGLFLPFVDLQADRTWKPKGDQTFLKNYTRVHILLGWILIPLVLAAITGLIK
jgi:hypothetical protein